jgi:hypothetical protein
MSATTVDNKVCSKCESEKSLDEFTKDKNRPDGRYPLCKLCRKSNDARWRQENPAYCKQWSDQNPEQKRSGDRNWLQKHSEQAAHTRKAWYDNHRESVSQRRSRAIYVKKRELASLLGGKCMRCGFDEHPAALQFHHRDPSAKLFSVSASVFMSKRYSQTEIEAEIEKCDLLCANCHFIHHAIYKGQSTCVQL